MRFLVDECIPAAIAQALREVGHDVRSVSSDEIGTQDRRWVEIASEEGRVLVTEDKDFGDLLVRQGLATCGIVVLRLGRLPPKARAERLLTLIASVGGDLVGRLAVLRPDGARLRRLSRSHGPTLGA